MPRRDTRLEAEGAEFLVLGALLLERIPSYKTYTNMPGYDLVATNADRGATARIQVKSRWGTGTSSFPIKSFDCDFVVFARLNRGSAVRKPAVRDPEFFVFPTRLLRVLPRTKVWGKVAVTGIKNWKSYKSRWDLIRSFLDGKSGR